MFRHNLCRTFIIIDIIRKSLFCHIKCRLGSVRWLIVPLHHSCRKQCCRNGKTENHQPLPQNIRQNRIRQCPVHSIHPVLTPPLFHFLLLPSLSALFLLSLFLSDWSFPSVLLLLHALSSPSAVCNPPSQA